MVASSGFAGGLVLGILIGAGFVAIVWTFVLIGLGTLQHGLHDGPESKVED